MLAETITIGSSCGDSIRAYYSRPLGAGPFPGVILLPHMPGWDEMNREVVRRFSEHGYLAICPNIYQRFGHGTPGEVSAKMRESGGVPDASVMGDCEGALNYLTSQPNSNGKVGVIGMCSGGRHAFLAGCKVKGLSAVVDCWGGRIVMPAESLNDRIPVAPLDLTSELGCPLMGLFGNDDMAPTPDEVNIHEAELKKHGKNYEFHRYDGAGHAFWSYDREVYRPVQAMDAWAKTFAFFEKHLK